MNIIKKFATDSYKREPRQFIRYQYHYHRKSTQKKQQQQQQLNHRASNTFIHSHKSIPISEACSVTWQ